MSLSTDPNSHCTIHHEYDPIQSGTQNPSRPSLSFQFSSVAKIYCIVTIILVVAIIVLISFVCSLALVIRHVFSSHVFRADIGPKFLCRGARCVVCRLGKSLPGPPFGVSCGRLGHCGLVDSDSTFGHKPGRSLGLLAAHLGADLRPPQDCRAFASPRCCV